MPPVSDFLRRLSPKSLLALAALLIMVVSLSLIGAFSFNSTIGIHSWLTAQQIWKNHRVRYVECVRAMLQKPDSAVREGCRQESAIFQDHASLRQRVAEENWAAARLKIVDIGLTKSETDAALDLFRMGQGIPQVTTAMEVWAKAIAEVDELRSLSRDFQRDLQRGMSEREQRAYLRRLGHIESRLARHEAHFGAVLHQAAPWSRYVGAGALAGALLLLAASGAYLGRLAHLFQEQHAIAEQRLARQEAKMIEADRMIAVGTLAAGVGHEINNPLTYVSGGVDYAHQVLSELGDLDADERARRLDAVLPEVLDALEDAREGTRRVRDIVSDLRTFARRDETEEIAAVDLVPIIELALDMAGHEIRHRATVVRDFAEDSVVLGNESRLAQVFLNLIVNAAQAIGKGTVEENEIRVTTRREGDEIVAEVRDTGRGISADEREMVFEPFRTTKTEGDGMGLGMAISRNIVRSLGGTIDFVSAPGEHTVFWVRLPAAKGGQEPGLGNLG